MMEKGSKIYLAGHNGLVGSAIKRELEKRGYAKLIYKNSKELDLRNQCAVDEFMCKVRPEYVIIAAAKVGGIGANSNFGADFITDNILIQTNIIRASHESGVKKLLFLGSSCIYPKFAPQPMKEDCLLDGKLEPTNEPYAIAKIAGLVMCKAYRKQYGDNYISVMPTNLYGANDNFDLEDSHVLPAMIRKFDDAKKANLPYVTLWGTGVACREFLHVDDMARACVHLMECYDGGMALNLGTGKDVSIKELAEMIKQIVGYKGEIIWDSSKPDGTPRKLLDITKILETGWKPEIGLREGIAKTYEWYCANRDVIGA